VLSKVQDRFFAS
jgi:hypothetical protein